MPRSTPAPLPENRDLAFVGERVWKAAGVTPATARRWLGLRNPHGKPNHDVLRRGLGAAHEERWFVDFPREMDVREAELYTAPFAHLRKRAGDAGPFPHHPHPAGELRAALARRTRYFASPRDAGPDWQWVDSELLPDDSLLVVARDDDFAFGVLSSHYFRLWWKQFHDPDDPARAVNSFPFPWPANDTGKLTRDQDDAKYAMNRAARSGDADAIDAAAEQAYGWRGEELPKLLELHRWRRENS